jgi:hypothetical protein
VYDSAEILAGNEESGTTTRKIGHTNKTCFLSVLSESTRFIRNGKGKEGDATF